MIGKRIKQLRVSKKLTQQQLADKIASSSGYISEMESGKAIPGGTRLLSLKRYFGVSIDWLLTGEGAPYLENEKQGSKDVASEQAAHIEPFEMELIGDIIESLERILQEEGSNLPPEKKRRLIELLYKYFTKTGEKADEGVIREHLRLIAA